LTDELFCIAPIWEASDPAAAIERAGERIDETLRALTGPRPPEPRLSSSASELELAPVMAEADYKAMVARAKDYIVAGDIFQVVLAQRFTCPFELPPLELYRSLRRVNPSPFLYFLDLPGFAIVGSSPEILVRVRDGEVTIRPIAGTRPRGATPAEDRDNEASLLADAKERAEHLMLLDLGRNDVGRVASAGSVEVTDSFTIERYSHVMHIVSGVQGELADGYDQFDLFAASFPAGTLVGAPKVRAMQIIEEMENTGRGLYAGTAGYFGLTGDMDQAITIRTLVFSGDEYSFQAGAGIVADSVPAKEYQEVLAKSAILRRALEMAGEGL
jgi:anthranilate synthase component 1